MKTGSLESLSAAILTRNSAENATNRDISVIHVFSNFLHVQTKPGIREKREKKIYGS